MSRKPETKLTPAQFEIMQLVWGSPNGATVADIWEQVAASRNVARTTILNLVGRLEKRGWLSRAKEDGVYRYRATVPQADATAEAASDFVDDFFGGSASELVMSLLGSRQIDADEVERLRELLNAKPPTCKTRRTSR